MLELSEIGDQVKYRTCLISNQGRRQNFWRGRSKFWLKGQELIEKDYFKERQRERERAVLCVSENKESSHLQVFLKIGFSKN